MYPLLITMFDGNRPAMYVMPGTSPPPAHHHAPPATGRTVAYTTAQCLNYHHPYFVCNLVPLLVASFVCMLHI